MAAPRHLSIQLLLALVLVPAFWVAASLVGGLSRLKNMALDTLYQFRGPLPAVDRTQPGAPPLKIIYVDVDAQTLSLLWGDKPWSRSKFAQLMAMLCEAGHPKAVGLDFILSPTGMKSDLLSRDQVVKGDADMQALTQNFPQVVLAAEYSDAPQPYKQLLDEYMKDRADVRKFVPLDPKERPVSNQRTAFFPYLYRGHTDPRMNAYPESPTYPIIGDDYGRVGLLNIATDHNPYGSADAVPRWVPMFAETEGPESTLNIVYGLMIADNLTDDSVNAMDDKLMMLTPKGIFQAPLIQRKVFYNLSVELALKYLGLDHQNVQRTPDALRIADNQGKVLLNIPLTEEQLVEVNWFSPWQSPPDEPQYNVHVSALQVPAHFADLKADDAAKKAEAEKFFAQFQDAIILIGPVDPILQDIAPTPFDSRPVPKVGVYGNLLKTFFSGDYIRRPPKWVPPLIVLGLAWLVAALALNSGHHAGWAKVAAIAVLVAYALGVLEAFKHWNLVLPLTAPLGGALSTAFLGVIIRLVEEEKQRKRIKGMFGNYLAPELVNEMVESGEEPQLGGHKVAMTAFFSDVQGFSGFSEVLPPDKLFSLMNEYLTAMTDILQAERGSLDKYIGDAIVAMYGAPVRLHDDALRACVAACRMQKRLGELRAKWTAEGDKWHPRVHQMRMRIGLNSGEAIVGNMGSSMRFSYTMMGDPVNLAARCESGAKQFGVYTMCTEETKTAAEKNGNVCLFRRLDRIRVKGRETPAEVYELVGFREDATPETLRCVELFEQGLALYFAQKWDEAGAKFAEAEKLEPWQPGRDAGVAHNPSELMKERCAEMKAEPPQPDWDGVMTMTEK